MYRARCRDKLEGRVESGQSDLGVVGEGGGGAQGVAGKGRDRGGTRTPAGDVTDYQHPAVGDREGVVEVAADFVLGPAGRYIAASDPPGNVREGRQHQAALQRFGDLGPRRFSLVEMAKSPLLSSVSATRPERIQAKRTSSCL